MGKTESRKLSAVIKELASTLLRDPRAVPSAEAAHAVLLLAHAGWNRGLGEPVSEAWYRPILEEIEQANPMLWSELADNDPGRMIERVAAIKRAKYADDDRLIRVCGMRNGNVHVEWHEGKDMRDADRQAEEHLAHAIELIASGDEAEAIRHICKTAGMSEPEARRKVVEVRELLNKRPR